MATGLPKTMPVLTAKDMYKGWYDGPNGTHCLLGWAIQFPAQSDEIRQALKEQIGTLNEVDIVHFNEAKRRPKYVLADTWNAAMKRLGYKRRGKKFVMPA